jgi:transcriptional regulator with XRE-family HTH domain/DNA-directed RNA polymerase subunit RPC12/RpoP
MDQIKIGKFIAERRKAQNLTQMQLAEKLGITDRAVSKWENGKALPDATLMLELCGILGISVNDLLTGEVVTMENYNEKMEKNLLEALEAKQKADKNLLNLEILVGMMCVIILLGLVAFASFMQMEEWLRVVLILIGLVPFLVALPFLIKIEQTAGYYACAKCGHRYVPTFKSVLWSAHMGRTRKMRCPKCGEKSWQKKVLTKE